MHRRNFLHTGALGATGLLTTWVLLASPRRAPVLEKGKPFQLDYAFHQDMFQEHASSNFLDEIRFAHDLGFHSIEDNGMMGCSIRYR
jgi:hydroxypyruvate isomerase